MIPYLAALADALDRLVDEATPGPWEAWQDPGVNTVRIRLGMDPFDHDPEPSPYWSVQTDGAIYPDGAIAALGIRGPPRPRRRHAPCAFDADHRPHPLFMDDLCVVLAALAPLLGSPGETP